VLLTGYRVESCQIEHPEDVQHDWTGLQERADCSYFQSWGWMSTWLEQIANDLDCILLKVWSGDLLVGMSVFVSGQVTRRKMIRSNAMFLSEYPFDGRNMVIEYNGLLADKRHKEAVYKETISYLLENNQTIDEFFFSGINKEDDYRYLQGNDDSNSDVKILEESTAWSVGLDGLEQGIDAFLETLSKNRKAQISRSIRIYEEESPLEIEEADGIDKALMFFDGLKGVHTERWKAKGGRGSFANPLWEDFHKNLIISRFAEGEIQILRVKCPAGVIGYLYNFVWRKRIYVLQTGFKISGDKRLMPGYVAHVMAIAFNKKKGMHAYDLMHGDALYKRILCKQTQRLCWVVLQRPKLRFMFEDLAVKAARSFRRILRVGA